MRITTQMLNATRQKAGLGSSGSLVDYLQGKGTSSRLSSLNASNPSANKLARSNYEKLEETAKLLGTQTSQLTQKVDKDDAEIGEEAASFVEQFNQTLEYLNKNSDTLNKYYQQTLKQLALDNKKELAELGVTVKTDGTLSLDKEKLANTDQEKLKAMFGSESTFMKRTSLVASRVSDNARARAESLSSRYTASGSVNSSYLSRYDFWS